MVAINFEKTDGEEKNEIAMFKYEALPETFKQGGSSRAIEDIKRIVSEYVLDVNTKEGRKAIKSISANIASTKVGFDKVRKALNNQHKAEIAIINGEWQAIEEAFNILKIETRAPLTEWEKEDQKRKEEIKRKNEENIRKEKERLQLIADEESAYKEDELFSQNAIIKKEQEKIALQQEADKVEIARKKKEAEAEQEKIRLEREELEKEKAEALREKNELILQRVESLVNGIFSECRTALDVRSEFQTNSEYYFVALASYNRETKELRSEVVKQIEATVLDESTNQKAVQAEKDKKERHEKAEKEAEKSRIIANDLKEEDRKKEIENQVYSKLFDITGQESIAQSVFDAIEGGYIPRLRIDYKP